MNKIKEEYVLIVVDVQLGEQLAVTLSVNKLKNLTVWVPRYLNNVSSEGSQ